MLCTKYNVYIMFLTYVLLGGGGGYSWSTPPPPPTHPPGTDRVNIFISILNNLNPNILVVYKNQWMLCNHSVMNLNWKSKKTKCTTCTKGNHTEKLTFKLKNTNIENVKECKYLGVIISK